MKNKTIFKKWPSSGRLDPAWAQLAKNLPETNVNCHLPTPMHPLTQTKKDNQEDDMLIAREVFAGMDKYFLVSFFSPLSSQEVFFKNCSNVQLQKQTFNYTQNLIPITWLPGLFLEISGGESTGSEITWLKLKKIINVALWALISLCEGQFFEFQTLDME